MKIFRKATSDTTVDTTAQLADELETLERVRVNNPSIHFGAPTRCPGCACYGFVEHLDLVAGIADNRCPACATSWRITQRALNRAAEAARRPAGPRHEGNGILFRDYAAA
jgi:hypothetical protein